MRINRSRAWIAALLGLAMLATAAFVSLTLGVVPLAPGETLGALLYPAEASRTTSAVIWSIRLPRILVAMLVGAALGIVTTVMKESLRKAFA